MRTVHLYGSLAEQFGPTFKLQVRSLAEAAHAIGCQVPGFRAAIEAGRFRVTCGPARGKGLHLDNDTVTFGLPDGDLHVVPVVRGAGGKSGGIGKIIVGTIIAAATWWAGGPAWIISLGASVALTGASQLLSPQKKNTKQKKSYMFDGADNTGDQGGCVPRIYGTCMVSSTTVSAGVSVADSNGVV